MTQQTHRWEVVATGGGNGADRILVDGVPNVHIRSLTIRMAADAVPLITAEVCPDDVLLDVEGETAIAYPEVTEADLLELGTRLHAIYGGLNGRHIARRVLAELRSMGIVRVAGGVL